MKKFIFIGVLGLFVLGACNSTVTHTHNEQYFDEYNHLGVIAVNFKGNIFLDKENILTFSTRYYKYIKELKQISKYSNQIHSKFN